MKAMNKAEDYTYRVFWSEEDEGYIATVAEFPGISSIEETQREAFFGIVDLVGFLLEEMQVEGSEPPSPLTKKVYSGEIRLRMPKEVHRRVAIEAAEQGTSINQLLLSRI